MKKLFFILIITMSIILVGCSSKPVELTYENASDYLAVQCNLIEVQPDADYYSGWKKGDPCDTYTLEITVTGRNGYTFENATAFITVVPQGDFNITIKDKYDFEWCNLDPSKSKQLYTNNAKTFEIPLDSSGNGYFSKKYHIKTHNKTLTKSMTPWTFIYSDSGVEYECWLLKNISVYDSFISDFAQGSTATKSN